MSRIFILKSNTACLDSINVRSPASSGRFDVVLDFVLECLFDRDHPRDDIKILTVLEGCSSCKVLEFSSSIIKVKVESEKELINLIVRSLIPVREESFESLLSELKREGYKLICLHESGRPVSPEDLPCSKVVFIIGDQDGFTSKDEDVMRKLGVDFISIGPISYLSWFCCVYVNYLLDIYCRDKA